MRRARSLMGLACALVLGLACFHAVLFRGEQFAYRDAGHFYSPLYRVVQQGWAAGGVPLWNPWQNGGTPMLGMPMAAVLYPGKLLYAILPYSIAAPSYVLTHTIIALGGMLALGRALGISGTGATLAALSYAFGAPVLSMNSNVIFLVGAAWAPWGFWAIHGLGEPGPRWAVVKLSLVLTLQVLGGDPESAYVTGASGLVYAGIVGFARDERSGEGIEGRRAGVPLILAIGLAWCGLVLGADHAAARGWIPSWLTRAPFFWSVWGLILAILIAWGARRGGIRAGGWRMLGGLVGAGLLAALMAAVQIGPAWEYARRSTRLDGPMPPSTQDFSMEPYRLAEAVWPHVFGLEVPENGSWIAALPPAGERMLWSPSLYVGGFVLALAVAAAGLRGGPPRRRWLTILALVGLIGGMGKFAGPLWWARRIPGTAAWLGAPDPPGGLARSDAFLPDGAGSIYGALTLFLPGFAMFRYPGKLMMLAGLCGSALAGLGWDRLCREESSSRRIRRWCLSALAVSAGLVVLILAGRPAIERWVGGHVPPGSLYGPVDPARAVDQTVRALIQGGGVYAAGAALAAWAAVRPGRAGAGALILVTADLAMAGVRIVWTVPRADLEGTPRIVDLIRRAEQAERAPGPFRIHRVEQWHPDAFTRRRSPDRLSELVAWERDTLDRLHAEPFGLPYTVIRGVIDIGDYLDFFEARATRVRDGRGIERSVYSFPRGGYDLWGSRYFIMPVALNGWMGPEQGFTRIAPADDVVRDPERARRWIEREGWQLLRNERALPRCWVVASAVIVPPTTPGSPARAELVRALVDSAGAAPTERGRGGFDPRRMAFVESDDPGPLTALDRPPPPDPIATATIVRYDPGRVEIHATMRQAGLVILADALDPGWELAIDGRPAPIWATNRLMRGALLPVGDHGLVYTYRPAAFRIGGVLSMVGMIALGVMACRMARRRARRRAAPVPA